LPCPPHPFYPFLLDYSKLESCVIVTKGGNNLTFIEFNILLLHLQILYLHVGSWILIFIEDLRSICPSRFNRKAVIIGCV
jgi:hypothetical protein